MCYPGSGATRSGYSACDGATRYASRRSVVGTPRGEKSSVLTDRTWSADPVDQRPHHAEGVAVTGSPDCQESPGDQKNPEGRVPDGQLTADDQDSPKGEGHGEHDGSPRHWEPSEAMVKVSIIAGT